MTVDVDLDDSAKLALEFVAVQLAVLTAAVHLWLGLPRLRIYAAAGTPFTDVRVVLFVLSAVAVLAGMGLVLAGVSREIIYSLGILLALGYIVGWLILGGHGGFAWEGEGHGGPLVTLLDHVLADGYLTLTKVTELLLLGVLSVLLANERAESGDDADPGEESDQSGSVVDARADAATTDDARTDETATH